MNEKHKAYLKAEFDVEDVDALGDDEFDELYEKLCDIEVSEVCDASEEDRDVSEVGELVADIVTYMGNQYADVDSEVVTA